VSTSGIEEKAPIACGLSPTPDRGNVEDDYRRGDDETRRSQRVSEERMKGLEPSTFCMARTLRRVPGTARELTTPLNSRTAAGAKRHEMPAADNET